MANDLVQTAQEKTWEYGTFLILIVLLAIAFGLIVILSTFGFGVVIDILVKAQAVAVGFLA